MSRFELRRVTGDKGPVTFLSSAFTCGPNPKSRYAAAVAVGSASAGSAAGADWGFTLTLTANTPDATIIALAI